MGHAAFPSVHDHDALWPDDHQCTVVVPNTSSVNEHLFESMHLRRTISEPVPHCPPPGPLRYRQGRPRTAPHWPVPQPASTPRKPTGAMPIAAGVMVGVGAMAQAVRPLSRGPPAGRRGPRHASLSGALSPLHGLAPA